MTGRLHAGAGVCRGRRCHGRRLCMFTRSCDSKALMDFFGPTIRTRGRRVHINSKPLVYLLHNMIPPTVVHMSRRLWESLFNRCHWHQAGGGRVQGRGPSYGVHAVRRLHNLHRFRLVAAVDGCHGNGCHEDDCMAVVFLLSIISLLCSFCFHFVCSGCRREPTPISSLAQPGVEYVRKIPVDWSYDQGAAFLAQV